MELHYCSASLYWKQILFKNMEMEPIYSNPREFEIFEKQSIFFEELRKYHDYWGGNSIKEMIDFCGRNNINNIKKTLVDLLSFQNNNIYDKERKS